MKSKSEVEILLKQILDKVSAPQAQVEYYFQSSLATRFAVNAITQNMGGEEENVRLVAAYGRQHGSSITNKLDPASVGAMIKRAEDIARNSPEDPEYMPSVEPCSYPDVPPRFFENVARITPQNIASDIQLAVNMAKKAGCRASGLSEANCSISALANSKGLFAFDEHSLLDSSLTMHGQNGSGYSGANSESATGVDAQSVARLALQTALAAQDPAPIEPGDYTVVFEPQAVYDFLSFLIYSMSARDADEGTTAFAGKVGQKLFDEKVTLTTAIDDTEMPPAVFGVDGLPARRTVWVRDGVVERLRHDRYWASQRATRPDPSLAPLIMHGQDRTPAKLITECKKGLLVKRLWYIRYVDRKELLLTGMTRDGLFLIEDGRLVGPVKNMRFNESPLVFLRNIAAMSRPERVSSRVKVPGVMSHDFTFSSKTKSV